MGSERRGRAVHGRVEVNPSGEEPTDRPRQKNAGLWEPYDGRLSRTVLREREGEVPSRYSPGSCSEASCRSRGEPSRPRSRRTVRQRACPGRAPGAPLLAGPGSLPGGRAGGRVAGHPQHREDDHHDAEHEHQRLAYATCQVPRHLSHPSLTRPRCGGGAEAKRPGPTARRSNQEMAAIIRRSPDTRASTPRLSGACS